jgi:hypothetical protein
MWTMTRRMTRRMACAVSVGGENTRLHVEFAALGDRFLCFSMSSLDGVFDWNDLVVLLGVLEGQG